VRAFDWSPTHESVVAVGLAAGEAALLRIDNIDSGESDNNDSGNGNRNGGTDGGSHWRVGGGRIGRGTGIDGGSSVGSSSRGVLSFALREKSSRACDAVALSLGGMLAAGLERARNDYGLHVWDTRHYVAGWAGGGSNATAGAVSGGGRAYHDPVRKFAQSEAVASVKFFAGTPDTLVAGIKGQCVRLYDLRGKVESILLPQNGKRLGKGARDEEQDPLSLRQKTHFLFPSPSPIALSLAVAA
jgi:hypothetical protein